MNYTSRSDFPKVLPDTKTFYCWSCKASGATKQGTSKVSYHCNTCEQDNDRVLIFDPNMQMSFDNDGRLVHESCGIFITRADGKLLLFKRRKYPFLLTIPAGHLETGEEFMPAAKREAEEEVGIMIGELEEVFEGNIEGDECLGGADIHHWRAYKTVVADDVIVSLDEEGEAWGWYDAKSLSADNTVQPVLYMLEKTSYLEES